MYNNIQSPYHRTPPYPPPPISVPLHPHHQGVPFAAAPMSATESQPESSLPSPATAKAKEPDHSLRPGPPPVSTVYDGRAWALDVVQQPVRARMCGFGDKDRRPITPPPCVRLIIMDPRTRKEIDINDIDTSFFVLTVDLWDLDASKEVNLVKHAANSPSISTVATSSYPPSSIVPSPSQVRPTIYSHNNIPQFQNQNYATPQTTGAPGPSVPYIPGPSAPQGWGGPPPLGYNPPSHPQYPYNQPGYPPPVHSHTSNGYPQPSPTHPSHQYPMSPYPMQNNIPIDRPTGMFTRNLIGSLSASAFKLNDTEERVGIWFILQDMSVRTEGWFRLKFSFVNVGRAVHSSAVNSSTASSTNGTAQQEINRTTAPVLASCFSQPFQVFSAKKFPGVIESTDLSRTFAQQGIKIPIRKDPQPGRGGRGRANQDDEDDDQDED